MNLNDIARVRADNNGSEAIKIILGSKMEIPGVSSHHGHIRKAWIVSATQSTRFYSENLVILCGVYETENCEEEFVISQILHKEMSSKYSMTFHLKESDYGDEDLPSEFREKVERFCLDIPEEPCKFFSICDQCHGCQGTAREAERCVKVDASQLFFPENKA